jgi:hypothetical protein
MVSHSGLYLWIKSAEDSRFDPCSLFSHRCFYWIFSKHLNWEMSIQLRSQGALSSTQSTNAAACGYFVRKFEIN